jgi:3-oxoacyl-[acyl-carrier protein] reductase
MPLDLIEKGIASMCPLKRAGTTSDIAKAVALLVSPDSEWINGKESIAQPYLAQQ